MLQKTTTRFYRAAKLHFQSNFSDCFLAQLCLVDRETNVPAVCAAAAIMCMVMGFHGDTERCQHYWLEIKEWCGYEYTPFCPTLPSEDGINRVPNVDDHEIEFFNSSHRYCPIHGYRGHEPEDVVLVDVSRQKGIWRLLGVKAPGGENIELKCVVISQHSQNAYFQRSSPLQVSLFSPASALPSIKAAIFAVGAGTHHSGKYIQLSFESPGVGQFLPVTGANPVVGEVGKLEKVNEIRTEILCVGEDIVKAAVKALKREHPYEEVAFEVYKNEPFF